MIELNSPWTLHFDRDGTEDIAIIRDADGDPLVTSRHFWRPEGGDPIPPAIAALHAMVVAPKLLEALDYLLEQTVDMDLKYGITLSEGEEDARAKALAVITETVSGPAPEHPSITIEVRGGMVREVRNLPPGFTYRIVDHDAEKR